jgi:hypothetical protein
MDLQKLADEVLDEQSLLEFMEALSADAKDEREKEKITPSPPYGPGANGWENSYIDTFLDAAASWGLESVNGLEFYKKPINPWKRVAQILYMGKIYE